MENTTFERYALLARPIVQHFKEDLEVIDKGLIEQSPGVPFIAWVRAHGTTIQFLRPADSEYYPASGVSRPYLFGTAGRCHILNQIVSMGTYHIEHPESALLTIYCDGYIIEVISTQQAAIMLRDYRSRIETEWTRMKKK